MCYKADAPVENVRCRETELWRCRRRKFEVELVKTSLAGRSYRTYRRTNPTRYHHSITGGGRRIGVVGKKCCGGKKKGTTAQELVRLDQALVLTC